MYNRQMSVLRYASSDLDSIRGFVTSFGGFDGIVFYQNASWASICANVFDESLNGLEIPTELLDYSFKTCSVCVPLFAVSTVLSSEKGSAFASYCNGAESIALEFSPSLGFRDINAFLSNVVHFNIRSVWVILSDRFLRYKETMAFENQFEFNFIYVRDGDGVLTFRCNTGQIGFTASAVMLDRVRDSSVYHIRSVFPDLQNCKTLQISSVRCEWRLIASGLGAIKRYIGEIIESWKLFL